MEIIKEILFALNNREISIIFWSIVAVGFIFSMMSDKSKDKLRRILLRESFRESFRTLSLISSLLFSYIAVIIYLFYVIGFWDLSLLKISIVWTIFVGLGYISKYLESDKPFEVFNKLFLASLGLITVFEFVIDGYVFPFWVEFLMIPIFSVIVLVDRSEVMKEKKTSAFISKLSAYIGLLIFALALQHVFFNYQEILTVQTAKEFLFPMLLMLLTFPFFYFIMLIDKYKIMFSLINGTEASKSIKRRAKLIVVKHCLLSYSRVKRVRNLSNYNLLNLISYKELDEMDESYQKMFSGDF